jgi:hypothetical protein
MPTTPIQQLPRAAADAPIYLVRFVGPFTADEIAWKKKSFEVRKDVVVRFDAFLREHNALPAYSAAVNRDVVDAMPDVGIAAGVQVQLVDVELSGMNVQQREALERDQLGLDVDADRQHRTVMANTSAAAGGADAQLQRAINILVRRGTTISSSGLDSTILESTFPELFPFGRGGPSEPRAASVGFERCVAHYLALSPHAFGQHATFVLVAKDITGRVAMMSNVSLRVHLDPQLADQVSRLSRSDADAAFEHEQQRRAALLRGDAPAAAAGDNDDVDDAPAARRLLRTARAATTKLRGSKRAFGSKKKKR